VSFRIHLNLLFNGATLYGCSNIIMFTYTTIGDGLHVYVCNACFKFYGQPKWIKYVLFQSMDYMKQILANNPCIFNFFHLLIYQWKLNNEITYSCMAKYNHLGYLTILYSIRIPSFNQLIHHVWSKDVNLALKDLLHQNLSSNPLIQKYILNIEKPNPTHGLCVLFSSIVE